MYKIFGILRRPIRDPSTRRADGDGQSDVGLLTWRFRRQCGAKVNSARKVNSAHGLIRLINPPPLEDTFRPLNRTFRQSLSDQSVIVLRATGYLYRARFVVNFRSVADR